MEKKYPMHEETNKHIDIKSEVFKDCDYIWLGRNNKLCCESNLYVMFRREFELPEEYSNIVLDIFAEGRYQVFINGQRIGSGPARYEPEYKEYDSYNIQPHLLSSGKNCIAVLVHYFGRDTFQYIKDLPGLIAKFSWHDENDVAHKIMTDSTWMCRKAEQWDSNSVKINLQLGFAEIYDARKNYTGWKMSGFDHCGWEKPYTIRRNNIKYMPRSIPMLKEFDNFVPIMVERGSANNTPIVYYIDAGSSYDGDEKNGKVIAYTYIYSPLSQDIEIGINEIQYSHYYINGREIIEFKELNEDKTYGGHIADIHLEVGWNLFVGIVPYYNRCWYYGIVFPVANNMFLSADRVNEKYGTFFVLEAPNEDEFHIATERLTADILNDENKLKQLGGMEQWLKITTAENPALVVKWEKLCNVERLVSETDQYPFHFIEKLSEPSQYALFDFGTEVFGRFEFEIDAPEGVVFDICYGENLVGGRINPGKSKVWYTDRYISKKGRQTWKTFDVRGLRYLQITIRWPEKPSSYPFGDETLNNYEEVLQHRVTIHDIRIKNLTYPVEYRGEFISSDECLNKIWEMGRYTLQLCMEDAYIDCPWRERGQWWGDARVQFLVNLAAFGDFKLMRRGLCQIGRGQREDGLVPGVYPSRFYGAIVDFSLIWVSSVWDYYWYSGDISIFEELFTRMCRVLEYFISKMDVDFLTVVDPKEWTFIDWADIDKEGKSTIINAFLYKSLRDTAAAAFIMGEEKVGNELNGFADNLRRGINTYLWDSSNKLYADTMINGELSNKSSVHANALMISYNIADEDRWCSIIPKIKDELKRNLTDNQHSVTGYFMHYIFEALFQAGESDFALTYMKEWWGWYIDQGHSTFNHYHHTNSSLCHAWSCSPLWHLSKNIMGVQIDYAFETKVIRVQPCIDKLVWLRGKYPHPEGGTVDISWMRGLITELNIELPDFYDIELKLPQGYTILKTIGLNNECNIKADRLRLRHVKSVRLEITGVC